MCFMISCSILKEDELVITRAYAGNFVAQRINNNVLTVYTTKTRLHFDDVRDTLPIPNNSWCYIQLLPESRVGCNRAYTCYFTWNGSDTLVKPRQDLITAEPY